MEQKVYMSKRVGNVLIVSELNHYTIYSSRLMARSLNQDEESFLMDKYTRLLGNNQNIKMFGDGKPWEPSAVKEFLQEETQRWNSGNKFSVFSIYNKSTQEFMGYLHIKHSLYDFSEVGAGHQNVAEIAYIIDQDFWGKGYGTEVAILGKKFIKHIISESNNASQEKDINEIVATVDPLNEGSKNVLMKTLKHQEQQEFSRFGGQTRILFFKPLNTRMPLVNESSIFTARL
ncbi:GNAT family N-acetyltransferase [Fluoribacter dumoffii]|uniref:GNAT family N-acetyltransferase n=1 Tax=Fluoribacter dumoffii TaxID=463 RepID=UPI00026C8204|nr:GNAT family N-acetyltransferase [Fluoribacter dumoffii]MCW8385470.1 GNAT family N-acetyltransferase [Fluoribacter dumoffii]MCW8418521.1 GNAT family N-acetyltransferase [Fluoribacter dumoffii]MCW8453637.1 GNAT family N-acetyltransferase [Fluoribacter dumoffii]MCW8459145.1 GNAT family N-acetyltransferase [Fluoribacter dumoffii]MCW8482504.1 GNAT family N-acetyltransferase [Fluoribacter dumoffii]